VSDRAEAFADLAAEFALAPGVTLPGAAGTRGFGSDALRVGGSIFAMLSHDELVVKLPRERVACLIDESAGVPFTAGKSTPMREWLVVTGDDPATWLGLAREAHRFVGGRRPAG
jgi:hypothetical protein